MKIDAPGANQERGKLRTSLLRCWTLRMVLFRGTGAIRQCWRTSGRYRTSFSSSSDSGEHPTCPVSVVSRLEPSKPDTGDAFTDIECEHCRWRASYPALLLTVN
jgi:hypothetical protein